MIGYLLVSTLVLLLSIFLFRQAGGTLSIYRPNLVSWVFFSELFVMTFIGANLVIFGVPNYLTDRASEYSKQMAYWTTMFVMIALPAVMVFTQRVFLGGGIRQKVERYFSAPLEPAGRQTVYWMLLSLISVLVMVYMYSITGRIPILDFFIKSEYSEALSVFRQEAGRQFSGNQYLRNFFGILLSQILSYVAYGYYRLYRKPLYFLWFLAMVATTVLTLTSDAQKAPVGFYLISLFFMTIYIRGQARLRDLLLMGATLAAVIAFTLVAFAQVNLSREVLIGSLNRIGMVEYAGMSLCFDTFPGYHPMLYGGGFPAWIANLLGVPHAQAARVLIETYLPARVASGEAGVMNTLFMCDAWANFGWLGYLIGPIWLGVLMQWIYNRLLTTTKTPVTLALMVFFTRAFTITGGLIGFMWNPGWIFLAVIVFGGWVWGKLSTNPSLYVAPRHRRAISPPYFRNH
jgi:hypothetical protein